MNISNVREMSIKQLNNFQSRVLKLQSKTWKIASKNYLHFSYQVQMHFKENCSVDRPTEDSKHLLEAMDGWSCGWLREFYIPYPTDRKLALAFFIANVQALKDRKLRRLTNISA